MLETLSKVIITHYYHYNREFHKIKESNLDISVSKLYNFWSIFYMMYSQNLFALDFVRRFFQLDLFFQNVCKA